MQTFFRLSIYKGLILLMWLCFPVFLIIAKIKKNHKTKKILEEWDMEESTVEPISDWQSTVTDISDVLHIDTQHTEKNKPEGD